MEYCKSLNDASHAEVELVGGKAAALGEMLRKGINVPDGFVVTTDAFRDYYNVASDRIY